ncbi:MAG: hypothetical protein CVU39_25685 [Chloroflexi bacterium HGW-Chloroflexi-10]|nr:MAG: hypothetical protein CVU39_25685 [Chloroflexi bacterium HGW-Chloroflexi-10]
MITIIDGHNLIPKIKGLSLRMLNDEEALLQILQNFTRLKRKTIVVYFDNAPLDHAGTRKFGSIIAHFVQQGSSADTAIISRVRNMGAKARQVLVVTSDRRIQAEVKACHALVMSSEDFVKEMEKAFSAGPTGVKPDPVTMSTEELNQWLHLFQKGNKKS